MEKYLFHSIMNAEYLGIVTILDYEMRLSSYLSELVLPSCYTGKKAIVDLALKSGVDEYRFVAFDVDGEGRIILNSRSYISVSQEIEETLQKNIPREWYNLFMPINKLTSSIQIKYYIAKFLEKPILGHGFAMQSEMDRDMQGLVYLAKVGLVGIVFCLLFFLYFCKRVFRMEKKRKGSSSNSVC